MKKSILATISLCLIFFWMEVPPAMAQNAATTFAFDVDPYTLQLESGPHAVDWKLASASNAHHVAIIEFVRKGDDINNWKELFTYQVFRRKGYPPSPEDFLNALKTRREKECPGATAWNTIEQDENSILYEWQLTKPCVSAPSESQASVEQHEIARIIYAKDVVFVVHYAAKGHDLAPDVRARWISRWRDAYVTVGGAVNEDVPFPMDKVAAALTSAMESQGCHVTKATLNRIECKRAASWGWTRSRSGGEKVTAALTADGNQTRVRIWTGKGFVGRFAKKDWASPVYDSMLKNLHSAHP